MDLADYALLPGVVIDVEDPKHIGRVKAMVPTWFDADVMQKEALPWIYPIGMCGYQRFSKLENGRKIFVLHNKKNKLEYWYWPMFEETDGTKAIVDSYDSSEVLLSRTCGKSGSVYIYYNDGDGIVAKVGNVEIQITTNNEIHLTDSESSINIVGGKISIGKESGQECAVMGEKLQETLQGLAQNLQNLSVAMGGTPVSSLSGDVAKMSEDLNNGAKEILSDTVKISK